MLDTFPVLWLGMFDASCKAADAESEVRTGGVGTML
jgi:hypothetical protein